MVRAVECELLKLENVIFRKEIAGVHIMHNRVFCGIIPTAPVSLSNPAFFRVAICILNKAFVTYFICDSRIKINPCIHGNKGPVWVKRFQCSELVAIKNGKCVNI